MEKIFYTSLQEVRDIIYEEVCRSNTDNDIVVDGSYVTTDLIFKTVYGVLLNLLEDTVKNLNYCYFSSSTPLGLCEPEDYDERQAPNTLKYCPTEYVSHHKWHDYVTLFSKLIPTKTILNQLTSMMGGRDPAYLLFKVKASENILSIVLLEDDMRILEWMDSMKSRNKKYHWFCEMREEEEMFIKWNNLYEEACSRCAN